MFVGFCIYIYKYIVFVYVYVCLLRNIFPFLYIFYTYVCMHSQYFILFFSNKLRVEFKIELRSTRSFFHNYVVCMRMCVCMRARIYFIEGGFYT